MDEQQILKELREADWPSIQRKLLSFTLGITKTLRWRGVRGVSDTEGELIAGVSCKDLVQDLIRKTLSRDRKWDPDRGPLMPWLKQNMRSEIDALVKSAANRHEQDDADEEGNELTDTTSPTTFTAAAVSSATIDLAQDPADVILHQAEHEEIKKKLDPFYEAAAEFPELAEIVEAIMNGCEPKPRFLAEELGVPISEMYNRLKRLRRLALRDTTTVGFPNA